MSVSNYLQFERRMHAVLLHIGRAGRPTNGVWEINVLYPQGPVLCTRIAELAWFNPSMAPTWAWIFLASALQNLQKCKLIQGELGHDNRFFSSPVLIYFQIKLHVSSQASLGQYWTGFQLRHTKKYNEIKPIFQNKMFCHKEEPLLFRPFAVQMKFLHYEVFKLCNMGCRYCNWPF